MSLNKQLLKGPSEYQPKSLLDILLHFREGRFGICGDIKEMFLRISVRDEDKDALRFLWRNDPSETPKVYAMLAMIFGARSSPCISQYVKNVNAQQYRQQFPRAVLAITDYHYVDDYVDSFNTEEEALEVTKRVVELQAQAGFDLRGISSNSPLVLEKLKNQQVDVNRDMSGHNEDKVLGLIWSRNKDEFRFYINERLLNAVESKRPTKREVASSIMSTFDPFNFLASLRLRGQQVMQDIWLSKIGWNMIISEDIEIKWKEWLRDLYKAKSFAIKRCHRPLLTGCSVIELHIFVDASREAYAAVGYWRMVVDGEVFVSYILGRCKIVPPIAPTIPRLELQAAVLGAHLKNTIINAHSIYIGKTYMWSDSQTVYQWIQNNAAYSKLETYHKNRLFTIFEHTSKEEWHWVPGDDNPADVATSPEGAQELWIAGPKFLRNEAEDWPKLTIQGQISYTNVVNIEAKAAVRLFDLEKTSSFSRIRRVAACDCRAADKFKGLAKSFIKTRLEVDRRNEYHRKPIREKLTNFRSYFRRRVKKR